MEQQSTKKIAIITGSARVVRIGDKVANFVQEILELELSPLETNQGVKFSLAHVDIADFKLPVFDEPVVPASVPAFAQFTHDHSKKWSGEMSKYDGYVLVTGEYNRGPPGAVKNAMDYLYNEIKGKPWMIISYGLLGGSNSSSSLKDTIECVHAHVMQTRPQLPFSKQGPLEFGLPQDFLLANRGTLGEASLNEWKGEKRSDIVKGFVELKEFLAAPQNHDIHAL